MELKEQIKQIHLEHYPETKSVIEPVLESIPVIKIEMDWDGSEAIRIDDGVIEGKEYTISYSYDIRALASHDPGDFYTPPSSEIDNQNISVYNPVVFDSDGDEIEMTSDERERLCVRIEENITLD